MTNKTFLLIVAFSFRIFLTDAQVATIHITSTGNPVMSNTKMLFGITFDARSSLTGSGATGQIGYHQSNGSIIPEVDSIFNDFPFTTVRYPGNGIAVGFEWKKSIGTPGSRPNQDLLGSLGGPQPVNFGFDEFMAMCEERGLTGNEIQIMVPIYDSSNSGLTSTQLLAAIPDVIQSNADWVEYCNSPNDGAHPWAALRAANGHPQPYNIKIWNIGNEPWAGGEYGSSAANCNTYLSDIAPIVDAMLAVDSTIHITMPTTGNGSSGTWANAVINSSLAQQGKIYALSQHYFGDEDASTGSPSVHACNGLISSLITAAATKNIKVFIGDYAHSVNPQNGATLPQQDIAMQWQGANLECDFLLMLSQKSTIERANFWVYGNALAVWHPIRKNANASYTLMPGAALYKILKPAFLDNSVQVATTSPPASNGNPYAVRSNAFVSNDLSKMNIIAVNRDRNVTVPLTVTGIAGFQISASRLLSASGLTSENIIETIATTDVSGNYILPPMSVLILEYNSTTFPIELLQFNLKLNGCKPTFYWTTASEQAIRIFELQRSNDGVIWETVAAIPAKGSTSSVSDYTFDYDRYLTEPNYFRLKMPDLDGTIRFSKTISANCKSEDDADLFLFPNPVEGSGTLFFSRTLEDITIFNEQGLRVMYVDEPTDKLPLEGLKAGSYYFYAGGLISKFIVK